METIKRPLRLLLNKWRRSLPRAVLMGLRLGVLSTPQVQAVTDRYYSDRRRRGTDYTSAEHNARGLFDWEKDLISLHFPSAGRIILVGAGGGREVLALEQLGYEIHATERNPDLVDAANRILADHGARSRVVVADGVDDAARAQQFDIALIAWSVYTHMTTRAERVALLRDLHEVCRPDAPLALSFHARDHSPFAFHVVSRIGTRIRRWRSDEPVQTGDTLSAFFIHMFTKDELAEELEEGGWLLQQYAAASTGWAAARRR